MVACPGSRPSSWYASTDELRSLLLQGCSLLRAPLALRILSEELCTQRVKALGCAYDLLGHWAEDDAWVYGFVSMVDGYHRGLWKEHYPGGFFDRKGDLLPR